jgi:MFS family permease
MPLVALALGALVRWDRFAGTVSDPHRFTYFAFALVFLAYGAALSAQMLANFTAVLDLARPHERPTLVGLTNSLLGIVALVPMLGGLVVDRLGFDAVFVLAVLLALCALATSGLLAAPRRPLP